MEVDIALNYDLVFTGDEIQCEIIFKSNSESKLRVLWASMVVYGQTTIRNGSFIRNTLKNDASPVGSYLPHLDPENGIYTFSSPQTIVLCDAELEPTETKRVFYRCILPINLPTSFFGSIIKYSYFGSVICQMEKSSQTSVTRFPIFVINPLASLKKCEVPTFNPKFVDNNSAESKDILNGVTTTRAQIQKLLGLKGDGRNWFQRPHLEGDEYEVNQMQVFVNDTLHSVQELLKMNSTKSLAIKRHGLSLVTILMDTIYFLPGDSIRGRFDFSNCELECLQTSVILRYTEIICKDEILLYPGEVYEHVHVVDQSQESTRYALSSFFHFVLPVDSFPQFQTNYVNLEWSLLFQFVILGQGGHPEQFQFVLPIHVVIHSYVGELDGKKPDDTAHIHLSLDS